MPHIGELGHQAQHDPLPTCAHEDWKTTKRRRIELRQPGLDPRESIGQGAHTFGRGPEVVAILVVVVTEPSGPNSEDGATARNVVDRAVSVSEKVRISGQRRRHVIEAPNSRHEHECHLWEDLRLPDGKILVPGVVTHATNIVEHPELAAERITRYTSRLDAENVIAGADCGFGGRIHPELGWGLAVGAVGGAALASSRVWKA